MIQIVQNSIDTAAVLQSVADQDCGANVLFSGTTRRMTGQRETETLDYECYEPMAIAKMESLLSSASEQWPIAKGSIVHRIGEVPIGEASIAVAVSSPHRADAFEAAAWLLERLKIEVPIWKREQWTDGSQEWVHPDGAAPEPSNEADAASQEQSAQ